MQISSSREIKHRWFSFPSCSLCCARRGEYVTFFTTNTRNVLMCEWALERLNATVERKHRWRTFKSVLYFNSFVPILLIINDRWSTSRTSCVFFCVEQQDDEDHKSVIVLVIVIVVTVMQRNTINHRAINCTWSSATTTFNVSLWSSQVYIKRQRNSEELRVLTSRCIHCVNTSIGSVEIEEKERQREGEIRNASKKEDEEWQWETETERKGGILTYRCSSHSRWICLKALLD